MYTLDCQHFSDNERRIYNNVMKLSTLGSLPHSVFVEINARYYQLQEQRKQQN